MRIDDIDIELVDVSACHRRPDPDWVETIREDMAARGQQMPIHVAEAGARFLLIKGRRRMLAAQAVGLSRIKAIVLPEFATNAALLLAQISAQILRGKLIVLDRAVAVAQWRAIYEATAGEVKPGPKATRVQTASMRADAARPGIGSNLTPIPSAQRIGLEVDPISDEVLAALAASFSGTFSEAAQRALGLNKSAVSRCLRIATIDATVRERIALHPIADHQSELLALSAEPAERQTLIANLLLSSPPSAHSVADAIAVIDRVAAVAPRAAWERISDGFARLPLAAKRQFIAENWDFIETILAERAAA